MNGEIPCTDTGTCSCASSMRQCGCLEMPRKVIQPVTLEIIPAFVELAFAHAAEKTFAPLKAHLMSLLSKLEQNARSTSSLPNEGAGSVEPSQFIRSSDSPQPKPTTTKCRTRQDILDLEIRMRDELAQGKACQLWTENVSDLSVIIYVNGR
jgi:hypothetical protein